MKELVRKINILSLYSSHITVIVIFSYLYWVAYYSLMPSALGTL